MKKVLLFIVMLMSASMIFAQTATMQIGDVDITGVPVGGTVVVPILVPEIIDGTIYTMQFFVGFDHAMFTWKGSFANPLTGIQNFHPNFPYGTTAGAWFFNDNGTELVTLWDDASNFHTMPSPGYWYEMLFQYNGGLLPGQSASFTWGTSGKDVGGKLVKGTTEVYDQNFSQYALTLINGSAFLPTAGDAPVADFMADNTLPDVGATVNFTDMSINVPTSWAWSFSGPVTYVGGTNPGSQNPMVTFDAVGCYDVTLVATNANGSDGETKVCYIDAQSPCTPGLWTGNGMDGDWFNIDNWDCGVVPEDIDVFIPGSKALVTISGGIATTAALTVAAGGGIVIAADGGLTTNGLYTNNGSLLIESENANGYSGTFINNGALAGTGTFGFDREMFCTGTIGGNMDFNWHYLAAPIDGFTTHSMFDYYVNAWSEATSSWIHVEGMAPNCTGPGPNIPLNPLAAWSVNYATDYTCNATYPGTGLTLEFAGNAAAVHQGPFNAPATFTPGLYGGWNMFANPYPSGLDMNLLTFDPNMVPGAAYWDGCLGNYVYWTPAVGPYAMAVGLGFFTEWTGPGTFGVTNAARAHNAAWFWKGDVSDLVTLQITGNEKTDITRIRFMEDAQVGFAKDGDFHKLFSTAVPQIYTTAGEDMLAINCLPETATVPMGMTSEVSGSYTISAIETSEFQNVVLEDLFTGAQTDLLVDSYTFEYNVGDNANRFVVHFTPLGTPELGANIINIWAADHNIYVQAPLTTGDIVVYNMMGQEVVRTDIEAGLNVIPMTDVDTYYIVKVIGSDVTETGKVFIK